MEGFLATLAAWLIERLGPGAVSRTAAIVGIASAMVTLAVVTILVLLVAHVI